MNRSSQVVKNILTMGLTSIFTILLTFIVRRFFLMKLGPDYLGLNGVFSSLLSMLSISDLGMESVFAFVLYRPLAEKDFDTVKHLLSIFRRVYTYVGLIILGGGIALLPFLTSIIGNQSARLDDVVFIFIMMLLNSATSYWFTYNRTLLNANQQNYVVTGTTFGVNVFVNFTQIAILNLWPSMLDFVVVQFVGTILINILISIIVQHMYPEIRDLPRKAHITNEMKATMIKNTIGGLSNKLGSIVVFASDNILLSVFVSLKMVGLYSNYTLIFNSISGVLQKMIGTLAATIGNIAIESQAKAFAAYQRLNATVLMLLMLVVPTIFSVIQFVIQIWVGESYQMSSWIVLLFSINFLLQIGRLPSLTLIDSFGLQWVQRWKSVLEAFLNIVFSLSFLIVFRLGIVGIMLGTIGSTLLFVSWFEPMVVLRHAFEMKGRTLMLHVVKMTFDKLITVVPLMVVMIYQYLFAVGLNSVGKYFVGLVIAILASTAGIVVLYFSNEGVRKIVSDAIKKFR